MDETEIENPHPLPLWFATVGAMCAASEITLEELASGVSEHQVMDGLFIINNSTTASQGLEPWEIEVRCQGNVVAEIFPGGVRMTHCGYSFTALMRGLLDPAHHLYERADDFDADALAKASGIWAEPAPAEVVADTWVPV